MSSIGPMKRHLAVILLPALVLSSMSTLVLSSAAGATGPSDGLEPDTLDNGSYIEPELEASDDSDSPTEPPPSQPATNDGIAPADGVETNETGTPTDDDIPEDAKPQQTVCGTAPTALLHQPGSCSSPYDSPPNVPPTCSWKLVEIVTYVYTPPVVRWIPKVVGWAYKLVKGVKKAFPITQNVAEEVEGEAWTPVSEWVQQLWCSP